MPSIFQNPSEFRAQRTDKGSLEIVMYDVIGSDLFSGISSKQVLAALSSHKDVPEIVVRLNSPGGSVFEGVAIYTALFKHPARIVVEVDGLAASAASVIAMAGDEIRMSQGAYMMVHDAWGFTQGPAEDHEKNAGLLRKLSNTIAEIYEARTKVPKSKVAEMMAAETWLTADEALAQSFATSVHPHKVGALPVPQNSAFGKLVAEYKNAPTLLFAPPAPPPAAPSFLGELARNPFQQPAPRAYAMHTEDPNLAEKRVARATGKTVEEIREADELWNRTHGGISSAAPAPAVREPYRPVVAPSDAHKALAKATGKTVAEIVAAEELWNKKC